MVGGTLKERKFRTRVLDSRNFSLHFVLASFPQPHFVPVSLRRAFCPRRSVSLYPIPRVASAHRRLWRSFVPLSCPPKPTHECVSPEYSVHVAKSVSASRHVCRKSARNPHLLRRDRV